MSNGLKFVANGAIVLVLCHFYRELVITLVPVAIYVIVRRSVILRCHSNRTPAVRLSGFSRVFSLKTGADMSANVRCHDVPCVFSPKTRFLKKQKNNVNKGLTFLPILTPLGDIGRFGSFPATPYCGRKKGARSGAFLETENTVRSGGVLRGEDMLRAEGRKVKGLWDTV
jgi:hypothetical protein